MPAAAATAAMVQEAAAMAPAKGTPEVGYLPAEATNGRTRRPAEPRRTTSTGKPAAAEPAAPAAARSPPAARRTPPVAAGAGRDPRTRSPSAPPRATASTAAVSRARAGRGSAAPRRRPDLPPAGRSRQLSGLRATDEHTAPPPRVSRQRQRRVKIQASPRERRRRRAPDHAALDRGRPPANGRSATKRSGRQLRPDRDAKIRASPGGGKPSCPM